MFSRLCSSIVSRFYYHYYYSQNRWWRNSKWPWKSYINCKQWRICLMTIHLERYRNCRRGIISVRQRNYQWRKDFLITQNWFIYSYSLYINYFKIISKRYILYYNCNYKCHASNTYQKKLIIEPNLSTCNFISSS